MQIIINRGIANTRLRDFYDVYSIMNFYEEQIEKWFYMMHFLLPVKRGKLFLPRIMVLASEAGAVYKVGNSALINTDIFEMYLEKFKEPTRPLPKHIWNKLSDADKKRLQLYLFW